MKEKKTIETLQHIQNYIASKGFQYQYAEIANFYLALKTKPFVILAGISGTGKTQLPRQFAKAVGMKTEQVVQIAVRPDWTDGSELLGYVSLDGNFIPKALTETIRTAKENPELPYFFILDEMNLARVEYYFSDFLSVIETRDRPEKDAEITTDAILHKEMIQSAKNGAEFEGLGLPPNLYLIGTVNMDETTHPFSRKVLDRANSIEMNDIDLNWVKSPSLSEKPLENIKNNFFKTEYIGARELIPSDKDSIANEMELLIKINNILKQADFQFAYRVRDEVAFYLILNKKYELLKDEVAMDFQLVQKILPRINGSSERVQRVLVELLCLLEELDKKDWDYEDFAKHFNGKTAKYKRATAKILFMLKRFEDDSFTSFWL